MRRITIHPRLDLYLTAKSPHPLKDVGCTICHRGGGEALDFIRADHRPRDKAQKKESELLALYANKHYRQVINHIPLSRKLPANLAYLKGLAYRRLGLFKNALASFERAAGNDTQFEFRVRLQQARILRSRKHYSDAADTFDALIQHNPQVAFLWFENALTHESHQLLENAKNRILKAIELQPKNRVYRLVYARVLNSLGDAAQALKIIDEVIAQHPRYKRAWRLAIQVLQNLDRQDKLDRAYTKLLELDPGNAEYAIAWSKVLIQQSQSPRAIALLESVVEAHSNHTYARYLLAQATYIDGNVPNSLKQLEDILKLEPEFRPALELKKQITVTLETEG